MKKNFILLLAFLAIQWAQAQIVNIPDPNFKNALLQYDPPIDTNGDGEIQLTEALLVLSLELEEQEITDPTGIEEFTNLEYLNMDNNEIEAINLNSLVNLKELYIGHNLLTNLDVTALPELRILWAVDDDLTAIDVSQNLLLHEMVVPYNEILSVDVSMLPDLRRLDIHGNRITDLDISTNLEMEWLRVSGNPITSLDVSMHPLLEILSVGATQVSSIDVSNNPLLTYLELTNLYLTSLDLSNNPEIRILGVPINNLTELEVSHMTNLTHLAASRNQLTSIDLSQNINLEVLQIGQNPIDELDLSANILLEELSFGTTNIEQLDLSTNSQLIRLLGFNLPFLSYVNLRNGNNEQLSIRGLDVPLLEFICVDDIAFALENFSNHVPADVTFVEDCSLVLGPFNNIVGDVRFDVAGDGCEVGDPLLPGMLVVAEGPQGSFGASTQNDGNYELSVFEGTYNTTITGLPEYYSVVPEEYEHTFVGFEQTVTADFCIVANEEVNDLMVSISHLGMARPGFSAGYLVTYENIGSTPQEVSLTLAFDEIRVDYLQSEPAPVLVEAGQLSWLLGTLAPFSSGTIEVDFQLEEPPINEADDILSYVATVSPIIDDYSPENNVYTLDQVIVNSQDPNDKAVMEGEEVLVQNADRPLHYRIRFQNKGTASAINVRIADQLDEKLDWTTFRLLESSHPVELSMVNGQLEFRYDGIDLPAEQDDPEGSNGYVIYRINPIEGIEVGDRIENKAAIYFDFNAPIITNTAHTTFVLPEDIDPEVVESVVYPNPASESLWIEANARLSRMDLFDVTGALLQESTLFGRSAYVDISNLASGMYFARIQYANGLADSKRILIE